MAAAGRRAAARQEPAAAKPAGGHSQAAGQVRAINAGWNQSLGDKLMNCQNHPEVPATAYCRACGKPVCDQCRNDAAGTVYCAEHIPAPPPGAPPVSPGVPPPAYTPPPAGVSYAYSEVSPGLAFFLGCIPGVGAIYNGQYAKGVVHAVI